MRTVNRFESNLLRILHCLMGQSKRNQVMGLLERPLRWPVGLSRGAIELVEDSLAKGTVRMLTRSGAWQRERHLRGDEVREGPLWKRSKPEDLGLKFSPASLDFLVWLTATDISDRTKIWSPIAPREIDDRGKDLASREKPNSRIGDSRIGDSSTGDSSTSDSSTSDSSDQALTSDDQTLESGDEFLCYLAARMMRGTSVAHHWMQGEAMMRNPLIALMLPDQFAVARVSPEPDFDPWMAGPRSFLLEAMQEDLSRAWVGIEKQKAEITRISDMVRLGNVQEKVLSALMDSAERHGRRDLCRFLVEALGALVSPDSNRKEWIGALDTTGKRISQRTMAYENASAFLRFGARLRNWQQASSSIGFFDEGYAESQLWKSIWEESEAEVAVAEADRVVSSLQY
ncbi:MAG: hypothetical protein ACR2NZ_15615 [Rubripirellula sp.]